MQANRDRKPSARKKQEAIAKISSGSRSRSKDAFYIEKSCTRNEMPNKYKINPISKTNLEDVYELRLRKQAEKTGQEINLLECLTQSGSAEKQPFYYTEDNEIASVEGFFEVHRDLQMYRKRQDKVRLRQKLKEKTEKIEELRTATLTSPLHKNSRSLGRSSVFAKLRLDKSENTSYNRLPDDRSPEVGSILQKSNTMHNFTHFQTEGLSTSGGQVTEYIMVTSPKTTLERPQTGQTALSASIQTTDFFMTMSPKNVERPQTGKTTSTRYRNLKIKKPEPEKPKDMATQQKFTEREVYKHLFHMTTSPRKMKVFPAGMAVEKNYINMFKSPKIMDNIVESCIKKAQRIAQPFDTSPSYQKKKERPPSAISTYRLIEGKSEFDDIRESQTQAVSLQLSPKSLGERITQSIINIENELKKSHSTLLKPQKPKQRNKDAFKSVRTKNKHILRSELEQNYNIKAIIDDHLALSQRMKQVTRAYSSHGLSNMSNHNYSSYYT